VQRCSSRDIANPGRCTDLAPEAIVTGAAVEKYRRQHLGGPSLWLTARLRTVQLLLEDLCRYWRGPGDLLEGLALLRIAMELFSRVLLNGVH
jgi:hypothetical protein